MSRRKDRERYQTKKIAHPNYLGFRGYGEEPDQPDRTGLETLKCTICGRKRNVPVGTHEGSGNNYICVSCQENNTDTTEDQSESTTHVPKPRKIKGTKASRPRPNSE